MDEVARIQGKNEYIEDRILKTATIFQIIDDLLMEVVPVDGKEVHARPIETWIDCVQSLLKDPTCDPGDFLTEARIKIMKITRLLSVRGEQLG